MLKRQTRRNCFLMIAVQAVAGLVLAFLAGHWLILCVILNILVPFLLVFLQSTQFNQKGYFTSAMGFVFFQLNPVAVSEFGRFFLRHDLRPAAIGRGASHLLPRQGAGCGLQAGTGRMEVLAGHLSAWAAGRKCGGRGACSPSNARLCKQVEQRQGDFLCR